MSDDLEEYAIIGPSNAGKTALISCLDFSSKKFEGKGAISVKFSAKTKEMANLTALATKTIKKGQLPISGTTQTNHYSFQTEVTYRSLSSSMFERTKTKVFHLIDGPGGALFPAQYEESLMAPQENEGYQDDEYRSQLIALLRKARGIVFCLDSCDKNKVEVIGHNMPKILQEIGVNPLPCKYLIFCFTKVDALVDHHRGSAYSSICEKKAAEHCRSVMGTAAFQSLLQVLSRDAKVAACWASVYGFNEKEGFANYDKNKEGLRVDSDLEVSEAEIEDLWKPFRLEDPFIYLTLGDKTYHKLKEKHANNFPMHMEFIELAHGDAINIDEWKDHSKKLISRLLSIFSAILSVIFHYLFEFIRKSVTWLRSR